MSNKFFRRVREFFKELPEVAGMPSGDARGHVRPYHIPTRSDHM